MIIQSVEARISQYAGVQPLPQILREYFGDKDLPLDATLHAEIVQAFANYYEKVAAMKQYEADRLESMGAGDGQGED